MIFFIYLEKSHKLELSISSVLQSEYNSTNIDFFIIIIGNNTSTLCQIRPMFIQSLYYLDNAENVFQNVKTLFIYFH